MCLNTTKHKTQTYAHARIGPCILTRALKKKAEHKLNTTKHKVNTRKHKANTIEHNQLCSKHNCLCSKHNYLCSEHNYLCLNTSLGGLVFPLCLDSSGGGGRRLNTVGQPNLHTKRSLNTTKHNPNTLNTSLNTMNTTPQTN